MFGCLEVLCAFFIQGVLYGIWWIEYRGDKTEVISSFLIYPDFISMSFFLILLGFAVKLIILYDKEIKIECIFDFLIMIRLESSNWSLLYTTHVNHLSEQFGYSNWQKQNDNWTADIMSWTILKTQSFGLSSCLAWFWYVIIWMFCNIFFFVFRERQFQASLAFLSFPPYFVSLIFWCFLLYVYIFMEIKVELNWIKIRNQNQMLRKLDTM